MILQEDPREIALGLHVADHGLLNGHCCSGRCFPEMGHKLSSNGGMDYEPTDTTYIPKKDIGQLLLLTS
jgi:hypothetical protein